MTDESSDTKELLLRTSSMEDVVKILNDGSTLWKVRGINKCYHRHYKVDLNNMSLVFETKKWWTPGGSAVPLIEIVEVREGWKTDTFNKVSDYAEKMKDKSGESSEFQLEESRSFSILHGNGGREALDLVANNEEERDLWVAGLKHLVESVKSLHQDRQYDLWLRHKFENADKDKNEALNLNECLALLKDLNLKLEKRHAKKLFDAANSNKRKRDGEQVLDVQEFVAFYHSLLTFPEIDTLYNKYADTTKNVMSAGQLLSFLHTEQNMTNLTLDDAIKYIQQSELSNLKEKNSLSHDGFYHFLLSNTMNLYNDDHQKNIHQDMTQPLSHYFINSSHNTYLTGHQLAGESSVEGYISALKKGCRVVELDVWDGEDGEPIIYHGHTLTSKITLVDVLRDAIKRYAFTTSQYPLILSIENHLNLDQQRIMINQFKDILGDELLTDPVPDDLTQLPSPESLKNRIIIKAKKPQGIDIEDDDEDDEDQDSIDYIDSDDGSSQSKKNKPHKPMVPELAEVVNVCVGKKFTSFNASFENDACVNFPSLRENKGKSLLESSPQNFIKFTERQVVKIYPLGTRTDSSNLKPYPFWSVGAQVVTLNMQTVDKPTFYNEALFRSNGNCGYVLKPDILLSNEGYNPSSPPARTCKTIRIKVISGQHLPTSEKKGDIIDPYVQVKVRGHPDDKQKSRTSVVKNNGFNPVWNEMLELNIKVADVALIYFSIRDESSMSRDAVLALACIPFRSLMTGYRYVHLTDLSGKLLSPAALFVHVNILE